MNIEKLLGDIVRQQAAALDTMVAMLKQRIPAAHPIDTFATTGCVDSVRCTNKTFVNDTN